VLKWLPPHLLLSLPILATLVVVVVVVVVVAAAAVAAIIIQSVQRWATGCWTMGVLGFDSRRGLGIFLLTAASRMVLGPTQLPMQ
jgi:short subunit fatty acids transporter